MGVTVISTFYNVPPQMACIKECSPSKLILLAQKMKAGTKEEKELSENVDLLKKTIGIVTDIVLISINDQYNVYEVAEKTVKLIESEHAKKQEIVVNITGGRRTQALGVLFAAFARNDMVKRIVYTTTEENRLVNLPKLGLGLTKTKRKMLELLEEEPESMAALAQKLKKTRGMVYIHLRELNDMGLIDADYKLTEAGRLALL